jgi:hypothetical protein
MDVVSFHPGTRGSITAFERGDALEYTVKSHVKVILQKLNAIGRTEAIAISTRVG